jgi:hypothetical protein
MIKRLGAVFAFAFVLTSAQFAMSTPASAQPAPPSCLVPGPGSSLCAGNVTFSSYYLSTQFRPIQGAAGATTQPDVQIVFNRLVHNVRAWSNDPDYSNNQALVHVYGCCWLPITTVTGDSTPGLFSIGGGGGINSGNYDRVLLQTDPTDFVNWRVEYQLNVNPSGPWCSVNAATVNCQTVTATVSPFAQGSVFDPFQGTNNGTGPQEPIDVTFETPLSQVAVTALDPDFGGNRMEAYAADGTLLATAYFDGDNRPGFTNWSTKSIVFGNIKRVRLIAADNDYTVFQGLTAWPMSGTQPTCTIYVTVGTDNCAGVAGINVLSLSGGRALVKLTFTPGYGQSASFTVAYNAVPTGFTVNIGDSVTNDGGGGDQLTQSNDAELMIQNQQLSVYGRDGTPTYPLYTVPNLGLTNGSVPKFDVSDNKLCWNFGTLTCKTSPWLYALNGQNDPEGPENYDIFAAFNQVITGRTDRFGTGVATVVVTLAVTR